MFRHDTGWYDIGRYDIGCYDFSIFLINIIEKIMFSDLRIFFHIFIFYPCLLIRLLTESDSLHTVHWIQLPVLKQKCHMDTLSAQKP